MARPPLSSFVGTTKPVANDTSLTTSTRPPLASFVKPTPTPVVPEKAPITMSGFENGQITPHFNVNTNNFGVENPKTDIIKGTLATLGNAALAPINAAEQAIRIPGQVKDIFTQNGGEGAYGKYAEGTRSIAQGANEAVVTPALNALNTLGNTALGGLFAGVKKLTGLDVASPEAKKAFSDIGVNIEDVISGLAKFGIEKPTDAALALQQSYQSLSGNPKADLIQDVAKPVINETKNIASDVKTITQKAIAPSPERVAKSIDSLESDYYKWRGQTKPGVKAISKAEARTEALNKAGTTGKAPARVLAEEGIVPKTDGTKFDTVDQANILRESVRPMNDVMNDVAKELDYQTNPYTIDELQSSAIDRANALKIPLSDKKSLISGIKDEYSLMREKYGSTMTASDMQIEKPTYWGGTKFDSTKPFQGDAYYQVGKSFQKGIEDLATRAGNENAAQLNRIIGDKLEAAKYLESLSGQTLKYGKLGKYVFTGIGSTLGNTVVGKILGALAGDAVGNLLMKADVSNPIKRMILNSIQKQSPEAYTATLNWLKQQGVEQASRLALPEPTTIYSPPTQGGMPYTPNPMVDQTNPITTKDANLFKIDQRESTLPNQTTNRNANIDSNIKPTVPQTQYKSKTAQFIQDPKLGMSIKDVSKIHPEDLAELRDFTDYVAGTYKPSTSQIVTDARRIAVKYGIISEKLARNISDKGLSSKITKLGIFKNK